MKMTMNYLAVVSCFTLGASLAWAGSDHDGGHEGKGGSAKMFKMIDSNSDGAVSRAEFDAFHDKHFKRMDANNDGSVSREEMEQGHKAMKGNRHKAE